jgi:hypothetical protein
MSTPPYGDDLTVVLDDLNERLTAVEGPVLRGNERDRAHVVQVPMTVAQMEALRSALEGGRGTAASHARGAFRDALSARPVQLFIAGVFAVALLFIWKSDDPMAALVDLLRPDPIVEVDARVTLPDTTISP